MRANFRIYSMIHEESPAPILRTRLLLLGLFLHRLAIPAIVRRRNASGDRLDRAHVRSVGSNALPIPAARNGSTIPLNRRAISPWRDDGSWVDAIVRWSHGRAPTIVKSKSFVRNFVRYETFPAGRIDVFVVVVVAVKVSLSRRMIDIVGAACSGSEQHTNLPSLCRRHEFRPAGVCRANLPRLTHITDRFCGYCGHE